MRGTSAQAILRSVLTRACRVRARDPPRPGVLGRRGRDTTSLRGKDSKTARGPPRDVRPPARIGWVVVGQIGHPCPDPQWRRGCTFGAASLPGAGAARTAAACARRRPPWCRLRLGPRAQLAGAQDGRAAGRAARSRRVPRACPQARSRRRTSAARVARRARCREAGLPVRRRFASEASCRDDQRFKRERAVVRDQLRESRTCDNQAFRSVGVRATTRKTPVHRSRPRVAQPHSACSGRATLRLTFPADVAELVDARRSGRRELTLVEVRVLSSAFLREPNYAVRTVVAGTQRLHLAFGGDEMPAIRG
jgi:hypothetical protein